jgi:hypothetical protein
MAYLSKFGQELGFPVVVVCRRSGFAWNDRKTTFRFYLDAHRYARRLCGFQCRRDITLPES